MASTINQISPDDFSIQIYEPSDINLIPTINISNNLDENSSIEFYVYDLNKKIQFSNPLYNNYTVLNNPPPLDNVSQINIDPQNDLLNSGFNSGIYVTYYNYLNRIIGSNLEPLYISEISSDRTEIRLDSTSISNEDIVNKTNAFISLRDNSPYFVDFYLNFGENNLLISNNIVLDNEDPNNPTILIKLYNPLPDVYSINSLCWAVSFIEEPTAYRIEFEDEVIVFDNTIYLQGPNYNLSIKDQVNNSTQILSYSDILNTSVTSSLSNINSLLESKEIDINIDYTDFNNFIHFSSAQTRLENFYYKIQLIEQYTNSINLLNNTTSSPTVDNNISNLESKINQIITNFDGWDYFMYYSNSDKAWPKSSTTKPYLLYKTNSTEVDQWYGSTNENSPIYGGLILSASLFDNTNPNQLLKSIPEYLREDANNQNYELFIDMVAQHYDNIWIYHNEVTQKYSNDNRLENGISKDLVADAIKEFGIKIYQNNFTNEDLYTAFLGLTPEGSTFPFPNITGSLPTPSGYEYVDTLISASNDNIPMDDVNKSLYKRIYHNLPYLLKSKGTLPGLRALITSYGIPDTVLRINEYGGKDKTEFNDWDYYKNEFNYAFNTDQNNFISSSWDLNPNWNAIDDKASTVMLRFKTNGLTANIPVSQSLWYLSNGNDGAALTLTYTGSAFSSGSYSGSIVNPYNEYATLSFYPDTNNSSISTSVYLPFYDGEWWSVMVNKSSSIYTLTAQNKAYDNGNNGTTIGFNQSSSVQGTTYNWKNAGASYFPVSFSIHASLGYDIAVYDTNIYDGIGSITNTFTPFSGSYQEIRYYTTVISSSVFTDYTMNPYSIEGNSTNSSANELAFRAPLGGDLYVDTTSIHPKVTGSWVQTHSFAGNSDFYFDNTPIFVPNVETFFYDQPIAGIKNPISDKIRIENNNIPTGSVLSQYRSLSQTNSSNSTYTPGINLLEVSFSPQNEINDDIMSQIGYLNLGEYIGDPKLRSTSAQSYPDLDKLRNDYFQKYTKNYNLTDFIRLIKFFDNSLFKMIKDFVPARTNLISGAVIKQHLLERNKYPQPQLSHTDETISGSVKPQWNNYEDGSIEHFEGGAAGVVNSLNIESNSSQSWYVTHTIPSGSITTLHNDQSEFYNGEYSGSHIVVSTQNLISGSGDISYGNNFSQSLFNNIVDARRSTKYQDIDYSVGSTEPINLDLLVSGSALKAEVQDSNYSLKRHTRPRYEGVKNTSEKINTWTSSSVNFGNYGKTPSIENLKTSFAYCDTIVSYAPEHMNASIVHSQYLIKEAGKITIPNITPNSLAEMQGNYMTDENIKINSYYKPLPADSALKSIIRGGYKIEPILYNQIYDKNTGISTWADKIALNDGYIPGGITGNYTMDLRNEAPYPSDIFNVPQNVWWTPPLIIKNLGTAAQIVGGAYPSYVITPNLITDLTTLTISAQVKLINNNPSTSPATVSVRIFNTTTQTALQTVSRVMYEADIYLFEPSYTFTNITSLVIGHEYQLQIYSNMSDVVSEPFGFFPQRNAVFTTTQTPTSNSETTTAFGARIWLLDNSNRNIIYTYQNVLVNNFNNPIASQTPPPSSGFSETLAPWSLKFGDEFRFLGKEEHIYMVISAYISGGQLIVELDKPIPVGSEICFTDFYGIDQIENQFLIRRYIPDASSIIFDGLLPNTMAPPFIIKPEYLNKELDQNSGTIISNLIKDGLI